MGRVAVSAAVVAAVLGFAAVAEQGALVKFLTGRTSPEVYSFGAKGPTDVELFRQVVKKRQLPTRVRVDKVKYPVDGASTKNIVTYVEVTMPHRLLSKDEVRVTAGGPGLNHVALSIGGRHSLDYTVVIYGQDKGGKRARTSAAADSGAGADGADAQAAEAGAPADDGAGAGPGDDSAQAVNVNVNQNQNS